MPSFSKHKTIEQCKIKLLQELFHSACCETESIKHHLALRKLALTLQAVGNSEKEKPSQEIYSETRQALYAFKANLKRRKKKNDQVTSSRLLELMEPAKTMLLSDVALAFYNEIDDYNQIDFGNSKHVELLEVAIDRSIIKISNKQGRPINKALDEFFIGLKNLYESATGKPAVAGAHFDGQPKTDFEKLIYLGYQIIRPAQSYPSALKAYERAISRNS